jgi:hypothetical protein
MKYIGIITFKIDIEAVDQDAAEKIAMQAIPHHFDYSNSNGGTGKFLRGLMPVVYKADETEGKPGSYWGEQMSPCIKQCKLIDGVCVGCMRTIEQIKEAGKLK